MQGQVGRLLNRLKRLADTSIDLEDFKLALEEVMEEHEELDTEDEDNDALKWGLLSGSAAGAGAAAFHGISSAVTKKPLHKGWLAADVIGNAAIGGGVGYYMYKKHHQKNKK